MNQKKIRKFKQVAINIAFIIVCLLFLLSPIILVATGHYPKACNDANITKPVLKPFYFKQYCISN